MAVIIELDPGESVRVGPATSIRLDRKSGRRCRLSIDTDEHVEMVRSDEAATPSVTRQPPPEATEQKTAVPMLVRRRIAAPV